MSVIQVPYHLDEYLPDLDVPLRPDVVLTPDLPGDDVWGRLGALYSLYVHLDLDVIDPARLPGLRFPAPGGPTPAQVAGALDALLGTGRVAAIGVACTWYPGHSAAAQLGDHLGAALT
jgi:hypothetical protein